MYVKNGGTTIHHDLFHTVLQSNNHAEFILAFQWSKPWSFRGQTHGWRNFNDKHSQPYFQQTMHGLVFFVWIIWSRCICVLCVYCGHVCYGYKFNVINSMLRTTVTHIGSSWPNFCLYNVVTSYCVSIKR